MPRGAIPAALKKRRGKGGKARKPKAKPEPAYDSDASNVDDDDFEGWDGYKPGGYHPVKVRALCQRPGDGARGEHPSQLS